MRILIAEDDFVSRRLLALFLASYGNCDVVANGQEAVDAVTMAWKENRPYGLICLDIMMPIMDGQQALAEIRHREKARGIWGLSCVKIIMITALGDSEMVRMSFRQQCEAYLVKPLDLGQLQQRLHQFDIPRAMVSVDP